MFLFSQQLKIGSRSSKLALWQAEFVAKQLKSLGIDSTIVPIKTQGDKIDKPLYEFGGKGLFIKELEKALIDGQIDIAVHSLKDMSVFEDKTFEFVVLKRDYHVDTFVSFKGNIFELEKHAKIGTSSLRRQAELLRLRDDIEFMPLRGNLDTRLKKLKSGVVDGIVVSKSGLMRLGLYDEYYMYDLDVVVPAAGQGVIAVEFLRDSPFKDDLKKLEDEETRVCIEAERSFVVQLNASCNYPIGAYAYFNKDGEFCMRVSYGFVDNLKRLIRFSLCDRSPIFVLSKVVDEVLKRIKQ
ncbi:hydroxymethylbilane synthase [Hippea jasoniae]|uniref:hydroxymethylbilane synthase n=1 Tax=Hippea jasoniae TaxID=944479 RepID=UPI00068C3F9C|nr:hydroxymethylbilane synthase [Hippea jasoniae]